MYFSDGTWSDGIVSAAKDIGISANELFEQAQKDLDDSNHLLSIITTARQIIASTVQVLTASSVHNSASSKSQLILNSTGKQLMSANEKLLKLCEEHISQEKIEELSVSKSQTIRNAEEMEAKLNILKLEKQLDRARLTLGSIRKFRYSKSGISPIKTSPADRNQTIETSIGSIDEQTMENVIKRASVLEMVNNLDKSPEFFTPRSGSKMNSAKTSISSTSSFNNHVYQRREFNATRSCSIVSGNSNPRSHFSDERLEEIKEET